MPLLGRWDPKQLFNRRSTEAVAGRCPCHLRSRPFRPCYCFHMAEEIRYAQASAEFWFHHIQRGRERTRNQKDLWIIVNKCSFNPLRHMQRTRSVSLETFTPSFHTKHHANLGTFPVLVSFWHVPGGSILQTDAEAVFTKGTVLSLSRIIRRIRPCMLFFNLEPIHKTILLKPVGNQECEKVTTQNNVVDVTTCVANQELPRDPCHPHLPCPTNQILQSLSILSIFKSCLFTLKTYHVLGIDCLWNI